jgi:hypothetical protein
LFTIWSLAKAGKATMPRAKMAIVITNFFMQFTDVA